MKQITFAPRNHLLTNTNTWTPDSQWLVFDVRPSGASFTGETIERVNIHTGEVEVIYRASQGEYDGGNRFVSGPRHETDNLCSP